jgi:hypothetical protein
MPDFLGIPCKALYQIAIDVAANEAIFRILKAVKAT